MKYVIYLAVALLVLWSVAYIIHKVRRQLKGSCCGGSGCCAGCDGCSCNTTGLPRQKD